MQYFRFLQLSHLTKVQRIGFLQPIDCEMCTNSRFKSSHTGKKCTYSGFYSSLIGQKCNESGFYRTTLGICALIWLLKATTPGRGAVILVFTAPTAHRSAVILVSTPPTLGYCTRITQLGPETTIANEFFCGNIGFCAWWCHYQFSHSKEAM